MIKHFLQISTTKYYIKMGHQILGRDADSDIVIQDHSVSSRHLLIFYFNNAVQIMDLNSTNGTSVKNHKIQPYKFFKVENGDEIKIGDLIFYCRSEQEHVSTNLEAYNTGNLSVMVKYDPTEFSKEALQSNTQSYIELQKTSEKLGFLYSFGQRISTIFELKDLFNYVLKELTLLFPMSTRAVIFIAADNMLIPTIYWLEGKETDISQAVYSKTIVNLAIREKTGFIGSDFGNKDIELSKSMIALNLQCTMVAPLVIESELLGLILLDSSKSINVFKEDDLKLLSGIANLISVKILNKRLLSEINKQANNLKISNEKLELYSQTLEKNNQDLIKAKEESEKANRLKSQFLGNISHELRTPLNSILGFSDLLKTNNDEKVNKFAEKINNNGNRLMRLINDITELSILDTENTPNKNVLFNIKSLISVKDEVKKYLIEKPVEIIINFAPDLPEKICADMSKVYKVIFNLVENAAKYINKGFISISFSYKEQDKNYIKVEVKDSGIGIAESDLNNIFEEFYQVAGEKQEFKGSGLGLTTAKKLVEQLEGEISAVSKIDFGSCFTFTFKVFNSDNREAINQLAQRSAVNSDLRSVVNNGNDKTNFKDFSSIADQLRVISTFRFFESSKIQKELENILNISPENIHEDIIELITKLKSKKESEYRNLIMKMLKS